MCRSWTEDAAPHLSATPRLAVGALAAAVFMFGLLGSARAGQLGALVSPGPLARAHAALEGGTKCQQCHEAGRKVTAVRCLSCHKPIAARIAARKGVHRSVTECVSCHVDHAGVDGDLRHLKVAGFNHAAATGYALSGLHAGAAVTCAACHKGRSFLDARTSCNGCHVDVHKPSLGSDCSRCHTTEVRFKQSRKGFDHSTARFALSGAHSAVTCEKCHQGGQFRDMKMLRGRDLGSCVACHDDPHGKRFGSGCTSCHTTAMWKTPSVNHARTPFPLAGAHAKVACAKCHQGKAMTEPVRHDRCAACHADAHRGSVKEDCRTCHTDTSFKGAPFDHAGQTRFALDGKHVGLACAKCHTSVSDQRVPLAKKVLDYRDAKIECVSCHADRDPHKGQFGRTCDSCHRAATFSVKGFIHSRAPEFYAGQHATVACEKCHVPDKMLRPGTPAAMQCVSCHNDVHLGQVGAQCERCHGVEDAKFAAKKFSHEQSRYPLTGKHRQTECTKCHHEETRAFPSRTGTAVAFARIVTECAACHKDPHIGQVDLRCETCHQTASFAITPFVHKGMDDFFGGFHRKYACKDCHKAETGTFPAGKGTTVRFLVGRTCAACHPRF